VNTCIDTTMNWICINQIEDQHGNILFRLNEIYQEQDDRGEADDIAITLLSENKRKIILIDNDVRNNFTEIK
jgi:predicted nucleic acid-binding protein